LTICAKSNCDVNGLISARARTTESYSDNRGDKIHAGFLFPPLSKEDERGFLNSLRA